MKRAQAGDGKAQMTQTKPTAQEAVIKEKKKAKEEFGRQERILRVKAQRKRGVEVGHMEARSHIAPLEEGKAANATSLTGNRSGPYCLRPTNWDNSGGKQIPPLGSSQPQREERDPRGIKYERAATDQQVNDAGRRGGYVCFVNVVARQRLYATKDGTLKGAFEGSKRGIVWAASGWGKKKISAVESRFLKEGSQARAVCWQAGFEKTQSALRQRGVISCPLDKSKRQRCFCRKGVTEGLRTFRRKEKQSH